MSEITLNIDLFSHGFVNGSQVLLPVWGVPLFPFWCADNSPKLCLKEDP